MKQGWIIVEKINRNFKSIQTLAIYPQILQSFNLSLGAKMWKNPINILPRIQSCPQRCLLHMAQEYQHYHHSRLAYHTKDYHIITSTWLFPIIHYRSKVLSSQDPNFPLLTLFFCPPCLFYISRRVPLHRLRVSSSCVCNLRLDTYRLYKGSQTLSLTPPPWRRHTNRGRFYGIERCTGV